MPGRRWTVTDELLVIRHIRIWSVPAIARRLGRTPKAVRRWCERNRIAPTTDEWVTSGLAAELTGYSAQALTRMARHGHLAARRVPGGRWWLFDPAALPVKPRDRRGQAGAGQVPGGSSARPGSPRPSR